MAPDLVGRPVVDVQATMCVVNLVAARARLVQGHDDANEDVAEELCLRLLMHYLCLGNEVETKGEHKALWQQVLDASSAGSLPSYAELSARFA